MELSCQSMHSRKLRKPKQAQQEVIFLPKRAQQEVMHAPHLAPGCQGLLNAKEVTCDGLQNPAHLPPAAADQKL